MVGKLQKHGDGWALVLDAEVLARLGIGPETPLEVTTDGPALIVRPAGEASRRERFEEALSEVNRRYGEALRRLAE